MKKGELTFPEFPTLHFKYKLHFQILVFGLLSFVEKLLVASFGSSGDFPIPAFGGYQGKASLFI